MQVKYVGVNMDEMGTKDLDSAQIATVKKYFDRMSLKKKTYKKGKSPKDIQKESIVYTMQGGKYKEVVYYPFNQFAVSLDGTWYSVTTDQDNPEPINDPADAFLIGTQKTGTHFYIYGNDYDISKQDENVEYIEEGISAGRYVVVKCHLKKGNVMNISFMTALSERLSINLPAIILRGIKMISCMAIMRIRIRSTAMMEQSFKRQIVKGMSGLFILNRKVKRN